MCLKKIVLILSLFINLICSVGQINKQKDSSIDLIIGNYNNKAIDINITKNKKTITSKFSSYKELKNKKKFKTTGVIISNYIHLKKNRIHININGLQKKINIKSEKKIKELIFSHSIEDDKIIINIKIKDE
ncbi:hypothetical protein PG911_07090 [Tenacibaculum ovolyticum]|uniref:hypothetical protein n=2 Tax=Tenacibaculum ovolyticum TaxID=104270 RepID=UPI0022F40591|nr:hypothetical protein [Tenacibaculum ovolyticum]WBX78013.1 hypothetical protein PG911_07090 [Tenacibaculum ovolyticum]